MLPAAVESSNQVWSLNGLEPRNTPTLNNNCVVTSRWVGQVDFFSRSARATGTNLRAATINTQINVSTRVDIRIEQ